MNRNTHNCCRTYATLVWGFETQRNLSYDFLWRRTEGFVGSTRHADDTFGLSQLAAKIAFERIISVLRWTISRISQLQRTIKSNIEKAFVAVLPLTTSC